MEDEQKTYRDLIRHAVARGSLPKSRTLLEEVRKLLHVTKPDAQRIEREVMQESSPPI
jgi:hypothetical protein